MIENAAMIILALNAPLMIRNSPTKAFKPGKPIAANVKIVKNIIYTGTVFASPP